MRRIKILSNTSNIDQVGYYYLPKLPRNTGTTMKGINVLCGCGFYWEGTDEW